MFLCECEKVQVADKFINRNSLSEQKKFFLPRRNRNFQIARQFAVLDGSFNAAFGLAVSNAIPGSCGAEALPISKHVNRFEEIGFALAIQA